MAWNPIVIGNAPNDGTGTNWRECWNRINQYNAETQALQSRIISAADDRFKNEPTAEAKVQAAINQALAELATAVFVPAFMQPYNATLVTFNSGVRMVREGGNFAVYDVRAYGAFGNGTTNDYPALAAAFQGAGVSGGIVSFPAGTYRITSSIVVPANVMLQGMGFTNHVSVAAPARILKDGNFTGVNLSSQGCIVRDLQVDGQSGNGGLGIHVAANGNSLQNVLVTRQGGVGIRVGTDGEQNCNSWSMINVGAHANSSHGFHFHSLSSGVDANGGLGTRIEANSNGGDGIRVERAMLNTFAMTLAEFNTGHGIHCVGSLCQDNLFSGFDSEFNTASQVTCDTGAADNMFVGPTTFEIVDASNLNVIVRANNSAACIRGQALIVGGTVIRRSLVPVFGIEGTVPGMYFYETDAAVDERLWTFAVSAGVLNLRATSDDQGTELNYLRFGRTGASAITMGFFNASPQAKPTVTGSRGGNAALASLLTGLATLGLITDSTTA